MSIERFVFIFIGIPGAALGLILSLFALTDRWDEIEAIAEWFYAAPLLILITLVVVLLAALLVRERRRKPLKTDIQVSEEQKQELAAQKAEARKATTLVLNEISSNRRLAEGALGKGEMRGRPSEADWVAHKGVIAALRDSEIACATATEAYDAFAALDAADLGMGLSNLEDEELNAAIAKAVAAEQALRSLGFWIEGPIQTRFSIKGLFDQD